MTAYEVSRRLEAFSVLCMPQCEISRAWGYTVFGKSVQPRLGIDSMIRIFDLRGVSRSIEFSPAVIDACSTFVITLDSHRVGAAALVLLLLAGGAAIALAKWSRK
jgi:hypothetical protein